jgi:hypothetical protein
MKARLLYRDRDFDWRAPLQAAAQREAARTGRPYRGPATEPPVKLPWQAATLTADLALDTLFETMAQDDDCILEVARKTVFDALDGDIDTILYRQAILQDCLAHPQVIRDLYAVAGEVMEQQKRHFLGATFARYPDAVLRHSIELMTLFLEALRKLRYVADANAASFKSEGMSALFATLRAELGDDFLAEAKRHLAKLRFRDGVLLSAGLGLGNRGSNYVLRGLSGGRGSWIELWRRCVAALRRLAPNGGTTPGHPGRPAPTTVYSFSLHPRDEAGARALAELRNRGIGLVAAALGQSTDHVRDFFAMLKAELAFYVGCLNLQQRLAAVDGSLCLPQPMPAMPRKLTLRGLYDAGLALRLNQKIVANNVNADDRHMVVVTGANQGGKSTFLRSIGLAQLMMQSGMFVAAEQFSGSVCTNVFTHYKREEDARMRSGKLDEELRRMSEIVDHIGADALFLSNESFAVTNEREGSEIGRQILLALLERRVRLVCVTHLYELARGLFESNAGNALFLRAERDRTFRLREGEPSPTSFGDDLYQSVFAGRTRRVVADRVSAAVS